MRKYKKQMLYSLIFILLSVFVFIGCSKIKSERIKPYKTKAYIEKPYTDPLEDKKALFLINKTKEFNSNIVSSKGIALVKIKDTNTEKKFKIAWATVFPDKIRLSFLVSNHIVETIISKKKKTIFFSHTNEHDLYSIKKKDPSMEKYIGVPLKISQIISILTGKFPIKKFDDAWFSLTDKSLSTIVLRNKNEKTKQYIYYDNTKNIMIISYENHKGIIYEMDIKEYKTFDNIDILKTKKNYNKIPSKIKFKDKKNRQLSLDIINFWLNPLVKDETFELKK